MAYFLLLVVVVLILWALVNPFAGLMGLLVVNILRPGELYPIFATLHVERVVAIVVILSLLVYERRVAMPKISRTVLIFWGTMFLSIPMAYWVGNSISFCLEFGETVAYHLLIVTLLNTEQRFRTFLIVFSGLIGWLAGSSLYLYMTGNRIVAMGIERSAGLTSAGGDPNTLGLTLVSALPLVCLLLTKDMPFWVRLLGVGVIGASVVTIINTGSRMSFFVLLILIGIFVATRPRRFLYIPAALVLLGVAWLAIPQQYKDRYATVKDLEQDESYQNRVRAWKAGWAMFKSNPITGVGAANFAIASGSEFWPGPGRRHWLNAHSLPLKAIGELGLIGTVAFIYMLVTLFKLNGSLKRKLKEEPFRQKALNLFPAACNFSLIVLLVAGYSSHNLYRNTWYMLASLSGAIFLLVQAREQAAQPAEATVRPDPWPLEPQGTAV